MFQKIIRIWDALLYRLGKEMSDVSYEQNKDKIIDGTLWDNVVMC